MPQVDLEALVCGGGGDGKVACETVIGDPNPLPDADSDPDLPAESFQVWIGDDIDWVDINAVYDRDDSTKGNTNPKSQQHSSNPKPISNSQRFSGNLKATTKAPIIGLPNKLQHSGYLGHSARKPPINGRIFPKKKEVRGKSAVPESDPGSPKVSCFGKVLSQREKERYRRGSPEEEGGCWASFAAVFRCCGGGGEGAVEEESPATARKLPVRERKLEAAPEAEVTNAPGLGGMRKFASGRRPASWGGDVKVDVDVEEGHVPWSGPLDREGMRGRR